MLKLTEHLGLVYSYGNVISCCSWSFAFACFDVSDSFVPDSASSLCHQCKLFQKVLIKEWCPRQDLNLYPVKD